MQSWDVFGARRVPGGDESITMRSPYHYHLPARNGRDAPGGPPVDLQAVRRGLDLPDASLRVFLGIMRIVTLETDWTASRGFREEKTKLVPYVVYAIRNITYSQDYAVIPFACETGHQSPLRLSVGCTCRTLLFALRCVRQEKPA